MAGPANGCYYIRLCMTEKSYYEKLKTVLGCLQQNHSRHSGPAGVCVWGYGQQRQNEDHDGTECHRGKDRTDRQTLLLSLDL